jgi:hypothetical protein
VPCDGVDCNTGACCNFDGSCTDTQQFICGDCSPGQSCWQGYGTTCDAIRCEGACCHCGGSIGWLLAGNCADLGGCAYFFEGCGFDHCQDGLTYAECNPPTAACCHLDCTIVNCALADCSDLGTPPDCGPGYTTAIFLDCFSGPFVQCCSEGSSTCSLSTEADCPNGQDSFSPDCPLWAGGTYQGDGTTCDPNPCLFDAFWLPKT